MFDIESLWTSIEALHRLITVKTQLALLDQITQLVEHATRWLLRHRRPPLDITTTVTHFSSGVAVLTRELPRLLTDSDRNQLEQMEGDLIGKGVPQELARRVAGLGMLFAALDIVESAHLSNLAVQTVAEMYFTLGARLHLHWLRDQILALPLGDRWHSLSRAALRDNLYMLHSTLATEVLQGDSRELDMRGRIEAWMTQNAVPLERWQQLLSEMRTQEPYNLTMLSAAVHSLENLIHPRLYIETM